MQNQTINKSIEQTQHKVLFNKILTESFNYVKIKVYWNNGFNFKVYPIVNSQVNKFRLGF